MKKIITLGLATVLLATSAYAEMDGGRGERARDGREDDVRRMFVATSTASSAPVNIFMDIIFHSIDNNIYSLPLFMCKKMYKCQFYLVGNIGFFKLPKKCKGIEFWFRRYFGISSFYHEKFDSNFGKNYKLLISESEN